MCLGSLGSLASASAGSATWNLNPTSGEWKKAANWTPATVPHAAADSATFDLSNTTSISIRANTSVGAIIFNPGASAFTITTPGFLRSLTISGTGIANQSGVVQNFVVAPASTLILEKGATVGPLVAVDNQFPDGVTEFATGADAGEGTFTTHGSNSVNEGGSEVLFRGTSNAATAHIVNNGAFPTGFAGLTVFLDHSSAGSATFTNVGFTGFGEPGSTRFFGSATAEHATINDVDGGTIVFGGHATAASATITNNGGTSSVYAGFINFVDQSTAGNASIVNAGGDGGGARLGAQLFFFTDASAGNATLVAEGGINGGPGAAITFSNNTTGGTASFDLRANATLTISAVTTPGITIGSLEGDGLVFLGDKKLTVGSNNRSTTFAGVIQDRGSLLKINGGGLALTNANTYGGGTAILGGTLSADNRSGSATGSGFVRVDAGTLGGRGIISGPVTIGSGIGNGAFLSPAGTAVGVLTLQNTLTFQADATYLAGLDSDKVRADKVVANGVTIDGGALISLVDFGGGVIPPGASFILIDNGTGSPISGAFANLSDGSTFALGANTYEASYSGGDGNDLTLTVVPSALDR